MTCPKCGGTNIEFTRENGTTIGASSASGKIKGKKLRGISVSGQNTRYKTVALCHDCGWTWQVKGEQEEKDKNTAMGCLTLLLIVIAIFIVFSLGSSGSDDQSASSEQTARWASSPTPLEDFESSVDGNILYLESYTGDNPNIWIDSQYSVDGVAYSVALDDLSLMGTKVESVIIGDGITSTYPAIFNSTSIERIYIPLSLSPIYDNTLAYIDDSLTEIYYGGTEDQWNSSYQHYDAGSVQQHIEDGEFEDAGGALANELNSAIGHKFTLDGKTIVYNASIADLK